MDRLACAALVAYPTCYKLHGLTFTHVNNELFVFARLPLNVKNTLSCNLIAQILAQCTQMCYICIEQLKKTT